jgi:hypothetical protein
MCKLIIVVGEYFLLEKNVQCQIYNEQHSSINVKCLISQNAFSLCFLRASVFLWQFFLREG